MVTEIVPINSFSDGDATHLPQPEWKRANPAIYLEKLASQWKEKQGTARPGVRYYLDRLPDGYVLFERARPSNAKMIDKHLYGHPSHKFFDSPNRFYAHFEHLMENGTNTGCQCTICKTGGRANKMPSGRIKASTSSTSKPAIKAYVPKANAAQPIVEQEPTFLDEEATPDTVRLLLNRLKKVGQLDCEIQEKFSMDWRAEKDIITDSMRTILMQPSWMPRIGELVLFVRELDELEICLEDITGEFKLYAERNKTWLGHPRWEAGIIGQIPNVPLAERDIIANCRQDESIVNSGFRVEPLPNPDSKDKSVSKQYKYLPLRQLRPFTFHEDYLRGVPEQGWHATVRNARTVMSTISLVSRHHFRGDWPKAKISARGMFLGSELLCCGDIVRVLPAATSSTPDTVDTVLLIESIKLEFTNLDDGMGSDDDENYTSNAFIYGKAFTTDPNKYYNSPSPPAIHVPPMLSSYSEIQWLPLHDPNKSYRIPFNQVASRLVEANAMLLWFPFLPKEDLVIDANLLSFGLSGIRSGRVFSSTNNKRVPTGKSWYWGDSRAEVLDIETLNSFQVSYYDDMRNDEQIEEWEGAIKVLEHKATAAEKAGFKLQARAKAGGDGMSAPTISAQDVADAEMEEGLRPGALLGSEADGSSRRDASRSDVETSDAGGPSTVSKRKEQDTIMIDDSQDELDMEPQDVIYAFGLGKTSPASKLPAQSTASSSGSSRWPSPSMSVAPPAAPAPAKRPRGRPPLDRGSIGSSLKRQIDLEDSSPATDDARAVLASFKKPRTTSSAAPSLSSAPPQVSSMKRKKQYDDESEEEEDDDAVGVGGALAAFKAPSSASRVQFSGVVIDID